MKIERKVVLTRHVLAVKDLAVEADYYINKLGFDRDFTDRHRDINEFLSEKICQDLEVPKKS